MPIDDALKVITRSSDDAVRLADEAARMASAGGDVSTLADDIARQSTHYFETPMGGVPDRVVLGAWDEAGVKDFYIRQAHPDGGIFYATGEEVWDALNDNITDLVIRRQTQWGVNQRFLQQQIDAGVPRVEYASSDFDDILTRFHGQKYDDIVADFTQHGISQVDRRRISFRELEVLYLRDNAGRFGYDLIDNTWVKRP